MSDNPNGAIPCPRRKTLYIPKPAVESTTHQEFRSPQRQFDPRKQRGGNRHQQKPHRPHVEKPKTFSHDDSIAQLVGSTVSCELQSGELIVGMLMAADKYAVVIEARERYFQGDTRGTSLLGQRIIFKHALAMIGKHYVGEGLDDSNG